MKAIEFTYDQIEDVATSYINGAKLTDLAARYNVSVHYISKYITPTIKYKKRVFNENLKAKKLAELESEIVSMLHNGDTMASICRKTKQSYRFVSSIFFNPLKYNKFKESITKDVNLLDLDESNDWQAFEYMRTKF